MRYVLAILLFFTLPGLSWANTPPEANAGENQAIYHGDAATLSGTAVDADGDAIVGWHWTVESAPEGSGAAFVDPDGQWTFFVPDLLGTYVLSLVVFDGIDYSKPSSLTLTVIQNQPPTAVAAADVLSGPAPLTVQFDGAGSYDPEGFPLQYLWTFGDGSEASSLQSPSHVYVLPGIYVVDLTIADSRNQRDWDELFIEVLPPGNQPPTASPVATPNSGPAPLTVNFTANAADADGDALSYEWDFGDGSGISTETNPTYTYVSDGTYIASLIVSDGKEAVGYKVMVVVAPAPLLSTSKLVVTEARDPAISGAKVSLWADVAFGAMQRDDLVAVVLEDKTLFKLSLADFTQKKGTNTFIYGVRDLTVRIDLDTQELSVKQQRVNLYGADFTDGATLEVYWGKNTAVETVPMELTRKNVWNYTRPTR